MTNIFSIHSIIEFVTATAALLTIFVLFKFRKSREVKYMICLLTMVAIWSVCYAFEFATLQLERKILWSKLSYLGISFLPLFYFLFTTAYSQKSKILSKRNIGFLLIIPVITLLLVVTNQYHKLIWSEITLDSTRNLAIYKHGYWFWLFFVYSQILVFAGLYNLVISIYKFTAYYKSQVSLLLFGSLIPVIGNFLYVSNINPLPGFDWTPVSFVLSGMFITIGILRFKMFKLVPFAKNKLIDTMGDAVIVINPDGIIEDCNPAVKSIFGIDGKAIIKRSAYEVFSEFKAFDKVIEGKKENATALKIGLNGSTKYYQIKSSPILNNQENFSGKLLVVHDVTQIRRTEIELKETNQKLRAEIEKNERLIDDLDSFAHTVAHDLKNSLGSIYSSTEVMHACIEDDNKEFLIEISELVRKSAGKSMQITQELLALSTAGNGSVKKIPLNMKDIFNEALSRLDPLIKEYSAEIEIESSWKTAVGHAPWVEEVWANYISNSIKYGGTPPKISVGSEKLKGDKIKFWIKDNGIGVIKEHQRKLFKKYIRLKPAKAEGYGLGLAISKRIIKKLDGEVGMQSTGVSGEGSVFYFILPAYKSQPLI